MNYYSEFKTNGIVDLEKFYCFAKVHSIETMYFDYFSKRLKEELESISVYSTWRNKTNIRTLNNTLLFKRSLDILSILDQNGVKVYLLKGAYVRNCYPKNFYRNMNDIDILVSTEQLEDALSIFIAEGYSIECRSDKDITLVKQGSYKFELHFNLFSPSFFNYSSEFTNECINRNIGFHKIAYELAPTEFLTHMIGHIAKHLYKDGIGFKSIFDIVYFINERNDAIDYGRLKDYLDKLGIRKIGDAILALANEILPFDTKECHIDKTYMVVLIKVIYDFSLYGSDNEYNIKIMMVNRGESKNGEIKKSRILINSVKLRLSKEKNSNLYLIMMPFIIIKYILQTMFSKGTSMKKVMFTKTYEDDIIKNKLVLRNLFDK